jgi:ATP-dependent RNA helicase RhlE
MFADPNYTRCLVFTKTKHGADKVAAYLEAGGVQAGAIHGNKSQPQRERTLAAFKAGKLRVLVATDIAARGIDVDGVSHVVNFELPFVPEAYVHRIGRTARAGKDGSAVSFVAGDEMKLLRDIEKVTRQKIPASDRRNDKSLGLLDQSIMASGVGSKASMPDDGRGDRQLQRGPRNPRRDGVKKEHGGQPHRVRGKGGPRGSQGGGQGRDNRGHNGDRSISNVVPFDPLAADRARSAASANRPQAEAKPDGEIRRRPRGRRPSNGGKGYVAKG